jgi:hypothetical protein
MTAAVRTGLISRIYDAVDDLSADDITDSTTLFVNKDDYTDVEVAHTEFNTFTKAHAAPVGFFVEYDDDGFKIDRREIRRWVEQFESEI